MYPIKSRCTTLFDKNKKTESVLVKALAGSALKNPNMMVVFNCHESYSMLNIVSECNFIFAFLIDHNEDE